MSLASLNHHPITTGSICLADYFFVSAVTDVRTALVMVGI